MKVRTINTRRVDSKCLYRPLSNPVKQKGSSSTVFHTLCSTAGALTLGLIGFVRSAGALDSPKPEIPTSGQNQGQKFEPVSEEYKKAFNDFTKCLDRSHPDPDSWYEHTFKKLSEKERITFTRNILEDCSFAIKNRTSDLEIKENKVSWLIWLERKGNEQVFIKSKDKYQELIGNYIDLMANPKLQRGVDYDKNLRNLKYIMLQDFCLYYSKQMLPSELFSKGWYGSIEEAISYIPKIEDKRFINISAGYSQREELIKSICKVAVLELDKNSGIKEPRIFNKLLELVDKYPAVGWKNVMPLLIEVCIKEEACINEESAWSRFTQHKIIPDEKLISKIEDRTKKILSNPPDQNTPKEIVEIYDYTSNIAKILYYPPFCRKECILSWQSGLLEKVSKAKTDDIPELLIAFKKRYQQTFSPPHLSFLSDYAFWNGTEEIYLSGKTRIKSIIQRAGNSLLDVNPDENKKGLRIINTLVDEYYNFTSSSPHFSQDTDVNNIFLQVLKSHEKIALKDEVINAELGLKLFKLTNNPEIIKGLFNYTNARIEYLHTLKQQALTPTKLKEIQASELRVLEISSMLLELSLPKGISNEDCSKLIPVIEPLYTNISEKIISGTSNKEILDAGLDLFSKLHDLPECSSPENNATRKFIEQTIINKLLVNLFESSKNLDALNKVDFRSSAYMKLPNIFHNYHSGFHNGFMLEKIIDIIVEKSFDHRSSDGLREVVKFIDGTYTNKWGSPLNFQRAVVLGVLDRSRKHIETKLSETIFDLSSKDSEKRIQSIGQLEWYWENINSVEQIYFRELGFLPPRDFITEEKLDNIRNFVKKSSEQTAKGILEHLSNVKVSVDIIDSSKNNTINPEEALFTLRALKTISQKPSNNFNSEYLEVVRKKLEEVKTDPYTRGMLYKALAFIPLETTDKNGRSAMDYLRDGIVNEKSVITARYIGEALGEIYIGKLFIGANNPTFYFYAGTTKSTNWLNSTYEEISDINKELTLVRSRSCHFSDIVKFISSVNIGATDIQNSVSFVPIAFGANEHLNPKNKKTYLLTCIARTAYGYGDGLTDLLKESSGYSNFRGKLADDKEGRAVDILKKAAQLRRNAKAALLGFGEYTNEDKFKTALTKISNSLDLERNIEQALLKTSPEVVKLFEGSLNYNTFDSLPYHTAALYRLSDPVELNKKVFNGEKDFSIFESYERILLSNLSFEYLRADNKNFYETQLGAIWDYINGLKHREGVVISNNGLSSTEKYERFKSSCQKLHRELEALNEELYRKEVLRPLQEAKRDFARKFLEDIPDRRLIEYIERLREWNIVPDQTERRLIWDDVEKTYKMWAKGD